MSGQRPRYYERWAALEHGYHTLRAVCLLLAVALVGSVGLNLALAARKQIVVGIGPDGARVRLAEAGTESGEEQFVRNVLLTLYNWDSRDYETAYRSAAELMTGTLAAKLLGTLTEEARRGIEGDEVVCRLVLDSAVNGGGSEWTVTGIKTLNGHTLRSRQRVEFLVEVDRGPVTEKNPWGLSISSLSERGVSQ